MRHGTAYHGTPHAVGKTPESRSVFCLVLRTHNVHAFRTYETSDAVVL